MTSETKRNQTQSSKVAAIQNQRANTQSSKIGVIGAVPADVVILEVGAMAGSGRGNKKRRKLKQTLKSVVGYIFSGGSSLNVLCGLVKAMFPRDTSRGTGSEVRGEGRERGYFD